MDKRRNLKERICAAVLVLALVLTGALPDVGIVARAEETPGDAYFYVYETDAANPANKTIPLKGAVLTIDGKEYMTDGEGKCSATEVTAGTAITVRRTGYENLPSASVTNLVVQADTTDTNRQEIGMTMNAISLESGNVVLQNGEQRSIAFVNGTKIEDANDLYYSWSVVSGGTGAAAVDAKTGIITAQKRGKVTIQVERNGQTAQKEITIKDKFDMTITANPMVRGSEDETDVTVEVTGIPTDAGSVAITATGTTNLQSKDVTASDNKKIFRIPSGKQEITFAVTYAENNDYFASSAQTEVCTYKMNRPISIGSSFSGTYEYGAEPIDMTTFVENAGDREISCELDEEGKKVLSTEGSRLNIIGTGTAVVTVKAATNDTYTEASTQCTITVSKKNVTIALSEIKWKPAEKIYDKDTAVLLEGAVTKAENSAIKVDDNVVIPITARVESNESKNYTSAVIAECKMADIEQKNENYNVTLHTSIAQDVSLDDVNITIHKRPLYVKAQKKDPAVPANIQYGKINAESVNEMIALYKTDLAGVNGNISGMDKEEGVVSGDEADVEKKLASIDIVRNELPDDAFVGSYKKALKPQVEDIVDTGNYDIRLWNDEQYYGNVDVVQEVVTDETLWSKIIVKKINGEEETAPYSDGSKIWVKDGDEIKFYSNDSKYNKANVLIANNQYSEKLSVGEGNDDIINEIYLSNENDQIDPLTRTTSTDDTVNSSKDNKIPADKLKVDSIIPKVKFEEPGTNTEWLKHLFSEDFVFNYFTKFINEGYTEKVTITDGESGYKQENQQYSLFGVPQDADAVSAIKEAVRNQSVVWSPLPQEGISVPASDTTEGYYVVLVKAVDNVGNEAVYASNGIVIDLQKPHINLKLTTAASDLGSYAGDVAYKIEVMDSDAVATAGISKIDIQVISSGLTVQGNPAEYTNSYTLDQAALDLLKGLDENKESYSIEELVKKSKYEISGKILAADCNSNNVKIIVTAFDRSGNAADQKEETIRIDITPPAIESITYDKTEDDGCYQERIMTIQYKERDFDPQLAKFNIVENEKAPVEKSLTELVNGIEGIKAAKISDSEDEETGDWTEENHTDNRTVVYQIAFGPQEGKDITYKITPSIVDKAGNEGIYGVQVTEKEQTFTIDNVLPVIDVSYDNNEADNDKYFKDIRTMTVVFKERNYDEDRVTFDVTVNGVTKSTKLSEWKNTADTDNAIVVSEGESGGDKHTYHITFGAEDKDIDYGIVPHIIDKAENVNNGVTFAKETKAKEEFTVDKIQPEIQLQLNSDQAVNESYYKGDCVMKVIYTERNFYEDGLNYDIALGKDTIRTCTLKELKEIEGVTVGEPVITGNTRTYNITFDGGIGKDEDYRITPHIKDKAGNTEKETPAEAAFTVDKTAPVLTAQYYYDGDTKKEPATTNEIKRLYTNQKVKAVVTIKERNFMLADGFSAASGQMQVSFNEGGEPMSSSDNALKAMTGTGWKKLDQKDTWEQTFEFDVPERTGDSDFDFKLIYKDLADNAAITVDQSGEKPEAVTEAKTYYLTVDKVAPELEVTYFEEDDKTPLTDADIMNHGTRLYQQKKVHARYEITERNFIREPNVQRTSVFEKEQMAVKYEYSNEVGTPAAYDRDAADAFKWIYEFDKQTAGQTFHFNTEANYTIGMTYRDLAGNEVVYKDHAFTVDWTAPAGEITIPDSEKSAGGIWASGDDKEHDGIFSRLVNIVYNFFTKGRHTTTMTSSDVTAGVEGTYYYIDSSAAGDKEVSPLSEAELNRINGWIPYSNGITVAPNSQAAIYEKIVDRSGNATYVNAAFGIISDSVNPTVTLTDVSATVNGIHNSDAVVEVRVTDPQVNGVYSGIERVEYAIESRTNVTASETGTVAMTYDNLTRERDQSGLGRIRVNAQKFNSNDVTVRATAYDNAGNSYTTDIPLKIDVTAPVVENIAWDTSNASNGKYYNVTRTATITVRERNFDPSQVRLNITNTDGTMPQISGWSVDSSGTSDNNVSRCTVSFTSDGDYNMNMSCTDRAGWTSNTVTAEEFTIDKTVPTINVTFDNNNAANGKYYKESRTATITVNEHNFNGSEVQTAISSNTAAPGVNGWSGGSDVHSATVPFTADGNYSFTVNYTDLAGNPAQVYNVEEFVVDQTKPEIEIFDIVDKSANNGEVAPGVRYSDTNYDVSGVSITYKGAQHDEKAVDGARSNIPNGESIKMADFEHTAKEDDIYTMRAKVTDLAGNFDEKEVTFSVNRFGSNFRFVDDTTEKFIDDYYNNEEKTLTIEEINVDTLTHRGITNSHDGDIADLEEGTDYTVRESGGEVSWKSYEYTIKKENFEQEGLYNITIDSVDRATNEATNKIKNVDIEFIIDKTAPTVVITGIENEGQYRTNERDITIAATDNAAMKQVEVYVDDNVEEFDAKTIKEQKGELPYTLTSSSDWQEIKAVAVDMAGNITDTSNPEGAGKEEWVSVLITSNVFVQFYRNTPLVIGTIAVLVVLAGGIILILAKKRRKDEETAG